MATFVGGAIRTLLGSDRVHQRILSEVRNRFPQDDIRIGSTEILLSSGIWPGLGLKISDFSFKRENCGKLGVNFEAPILIVPVGIWGLYKSEVSLGHVEIHRGKAHLHYKNCSPLTMAKEKTPVPPDQPLALKSGAPEPERPLWNPPTFDWKQIGKIVDSAEIKDFALTFEREPTWKVHIQDAELEFGGELFGHALVDVQKSLPFGTLNHSVDIEARGEGSVVQMQLTSEFKEGRVFWKGSWDSSTHSAMSSLNLSQLPLKEVVNELYLMGFLENEVPLRSAWLSCQAGWEGSITRPIETPVKVNGCKVEGTYGGIQMEEAHLYPLAQNKLKVPIQFKVQNLQVQPLVEAFNKQILPAVINRLGVWSGQVEFLNRNSWSLDGFLDGAEVVFSNQSVRGKQQLRRIHTVAHQVEGLLAAKVDQLELNEGKFEGVIEATLNDDWRNGTFSVNIANIAFSPGIQTLLTGGTWSVLKLVGHGRLQSGEVSEWRGVMESPRMLGMGWTGEKVSATSRYQPGLFSIEGRVENLELGGGWRYYPQVREHLALNGEALKWKDVRAKIEVKKAGGDIQSFFATDTRNGKIWRGRGNWQRERELIALLTGIIDGQQKNFAIRAEKGFLTMDEAPRAP